jgi:hypothetical protein
MSLRTLFHAIDRPAAEAMSLSARPLVHTLARAVLGLAAVCAASAVAALLDPAVRASGKPPASDPLYALLEAVLVVLPGTVIFLTYASTRVSPRSMLAASSIGLLIGGVVAGALVPLMAFLALVSRAALSPVVSPAVLVPFAALAAIASTPSRVLSAVDPRPEVRWVGWTFAALLVVVFALRASPALRGSL